VIFAYIVNAQLEKSVIIQTMVTAITVTFACGSCKTDGGFDEVAEAGEED